MKKHVLIVFADDQHTEKIAKTIESIVQQLREHKQKGELRNTWYAVHNSTDKEWEQLTNKQAHKIALMQILGKKSADLSEDKLSEDTKQRIKEAHKRIFRAMVT